MMNHHIDLALLHSFVTLAESGRFTKAAALVGRSQSALTQQIQKLEDLLGGELLVRGRKSLTLTPRGEITLNYGRKMLMLQEQLHAEMTGGDMQGEVRFGSPEDFASHYLPTILQRFTLTHPKITLDVNCELTLNLLEAWRQGQYDVIIIKQEPGHIAPGAIPLWREPLVWVGLLDVFNRCQPEGGPLSLVLSPAPCVYRERTLAALSEARLPWRLVYTSPSLAGAVAAVRAGLGLTVLPKKIVPPDLKALPGTTILPRLQETVICVLVRPNPSPAVRAFAEYVTNLLPHD